MKNLPIKGVPQNLKNSIEPFLYNDFQNLEKIVSKNDIAAIKMEVQRNEKPKNNFLGKIRELATKKKIILIFDECTTGFRQTYGGLHKYYNVNPDMAIFGKAMGNGYAINAVIGKREVMENAQSTFISSTFWTERIGPTAAIATLDLMEKTKSWETITQIGKKITNAWKKISKNHNLKIKTRGIPALTSFEFDDELNNYFKTFITQEMLKNKIFASNVVYVCTYHSSKVLEKYFGVLDEIFKKIKNCEKNKKNILKLLETEPAMMGLRQSR
jgi:glutamate-1-semialdehyde aminotransferase